MALNYGTNPTFTGRITAPDANYPQGSSKDETAPGANDGMPYVKQRADDILGMQQALLLEAGITPSGSADTALQSDYLDAMKLILKAGRKNLIINGDMQFWQRSTSSAVVGYNSVDRFRNNNSGQTVARSLDAPGGFAYSASLVTASGNAELRQGIELPAAGEAGRFEIGRTYTVSYWIKGSVGGDDARLFLAFVDAVGSATNKVDIASVSVGTVTTAWQRVSHTFTLAYAPVGTNLALEVTPFLVTPSADIFITGVQFEEGSIATEFDYRLAADELALCQRYYETGQMLYQGHTQAAYLAATQQIYAVRKRSLPTLGLTHNSGSGYDNTPVPVQNTAQVIGIRETGTGTQNGFWIVDWTADAEL